VTAAIQILGYLVSAGFLALGLLTLRDWLLHRSRRRGYLALAIGLISVTNLLGQVGTLTGGRFSAIITPITIVAFMASAYALLLFRGSFIHLSRTANLVALGAIAAASLAFLIVGAPPRGSHPTATQSLVTSGLVLVWSAVVGEPIVRFWLASIGRPGVQRARLRVLSGGFAGIVFILLIAGLAQSAAQNPVVQFTFQLVALLIVPLLYASFAPPRWLRRFWRENEEEELRRGTRDLLLFSPDRGTLASRSLEAGLRLVGADAGAIIDSGQVLAIKGMEETAARELADQAEQAHSEERVFPLTGTGNQNAIVIPLGLERTRGAVVVLSGAFMPLFGSDEVLRFEQFSTNLGLALDRVRVVERMADVERTKSQFLNLASHELRTPLSVIRGYVSILESGSLGTLNSAGRHAISILSAKALEMNLLIEQMLEAARLEEGRLALRIERVDLCKAASDAIELVRPLADDRHPLTVEGTDGEVPVMADPDRLSTILSNLVDNGIKYSPGGGPVTCTVSRDHGSATVKVRDQGVGIAPADVAVLFTRFGRVLSDDTRHIKGTGLGLYLSRELARQMGGDVTVESSQGKGSTFTLHMPVAADAPVAEPKAAHGLRVLESTGTGQA
jgi:signal transduction histidine kinase